MDSIIEEIYLGDDFHWRAEVRDGLIFLHVDVFKTDVKTIKKMKKYLSLLLRSLPEAPYSYTRNGRFAKLLGATYKTSFILHDEEYGVWIWELK